MNAVDILKHCRAAQRDITDLTEQLERKREILTALPTLKTDDTGGGRGTPERDKIGRVLADIDLIEREIRTREAERDAESIAAASFLDRLSPTESKILFEYYIKRWDTGKIASTSNYTDGYIRKAKRDAEKKLSLVSYEKIKYLFPDWYNNGQASE